MIREAVFIECAFKEELGRLSNAFRKLSSE